MKNKNITKTEIVLYFIILIESILVKLLSPLLFPSKYFSDSEFLLNISNGNAIGDNSYSFAAGFFKMINIFNLDTVFAWSCFCALVMIPVLIIILRKTQKPNKKQCLFILASVFLLNLYILTISKDFIHFIIILIIYAFLIKNKNSKKNAIIITALLALEGLLFRKYYVIMAAIFYASVFLINRRTKMKNSKKVFIISVLLLFVGISVLRQFSPTIYNAIAGARSAVNDSRTIETTTMISDIFPNTNMGLYLLNYVLNGVRMLFPIELIGKGLMFIPYVVYQIFITMVFILSIKHFNKKSTIATSLFLAFLLTSILFEPDYGSFLRHESVYFLLIVYIDNVIMESRKNA